MASQDQVGILLESGTNEVEILEFYVNGQSFGINVAKIQEIVQYAGKLSTKMPEQPSGILGTYLVRDNMYLLVDLRKHLFNKQTEIEEGNNCKNVVLITEFNKNKTGFLLESVNRIYRCSWSKLTPINDYAITNNIAVLGTINIENRDIIILDLESVLAHLVPTFDRLDNMEVEEQSHDRHVPDRAQAQIFVVEDSSYIREHLVRNLQKIGYENITQFQDGQSAFESIKFLWAKNKSEGKPISDSISAVITDIEMPCLDGLSLCNLIRNDLHLNNLPVIMFSSLVNEQMQLKCKSVGGNACLNKADAKQLVELLDHYCIDEKAAASS